MRSAAAMLIGFCAMGPGVSVARHAAALAQRLCCLGDWLPSNAGRGGGGSAAPGGGGAAGLALQGRAPRQPPPASAVFATSHLAAQLPAPGFSVENLAETPRPNTRLL